MARPKKLTPAEIASANNKYSEMNKLLQSGADLSRKVAERAGIHENSIKNILNSYIKYEDASSAVSDLQEKIVESQKKGKEILAAIYITQQKIFKKEIEREKIQKKITDQMSGSVENLKSMAKQIPLVGDKLDKALTTGAKKFGKALSESMAMGQSGLSGISKAAKSTFGKGGVLLVGIAGAAAALYGLYKIFQQMDQLSSDFAKSTGQSSSNATQMANSMKQMGVNMERGYKTVNAFNARLGDVNAINKNNISQFSDMLELSNKLQIQFGLTAEETAGLAVNAKMMGVDMEVLTFRTLEMAENVERAGGGLINSQKVLKDISKLSKTNTIRFGQNADALVRSASAAQMLGTDISTMLDKSTAMLDIESSLEKEMMARALTGKDINYDVIREASLRGDVAGVLAGQVDALKSVTKEQMRNPIIAKRFADSLGMSTDEAIKMQENIAVAEKAGFDVAKFMRGEVSMSDLKSGMKNLNAEEKTRLNKMISDKNAASVQEEFNEMLLDLKEALLPIMKPIVKLLKGLAKIVKFLDKVTFGFSSLLLAIGAAVIAMKSMRGMMRMGGGGMGGAGGAMGGGGGGIMGGGGGGAGGGGGGRMTKGGKPDMRFKANKGAKGGMKGLKGLKGGGKMGALLKGGASLLGIGGGAAGGGGKGLMAKASKAITKNGAKLMKGMSSIPGIAALIEGIFTHMDIKNMIAGGLQGDELYNSIGSSVLSSIGGVMGGLGAAALSQSLNVVPGLGVLAGPLAYMLGDSLGRWLGGTIAENAPGLATPVGKFVGNTFYGDAIKGGSNKSTMTAAPDNTNVKLNDGTVEFNGNDKIGGVLDNNSVNEMVTLLKQLVSNTSQRQHIVFEDEQVIKMGDKISARKSFV